MSARDQLDELNERLDKLYSIKRQITSGFAKAYGGMNAKAIILRDTSNFILKKPQNQMSKKEQSRLKDMILSFSTHVEANSIISYKYVKSSFFVMYNNGINENKTYPSFANSGVIDIDGIPYTSKNFIDLQ